MIEKLKLSIRKASKTDLKEVSEIFYKESSKKPYSQEWTEETALDKIKELFKNGDIYVTVQDNLLGFVSCRKTHQGKNVFIDELWVKSGHQRKGVGRALVSFIENEYRKRGVSTITLISDKKSGAFAFYKTLDYKESK